MPTAEPPTLPTPGATSRTLAALVAAPGEGGATTFALRYGIARHSGEGLVAGVCSALAQAYGLPVRLVRIFAFTLLIAGPGLFLYLVLFLGIPRQSRLQEDEDALNYETPLGSLLARKPQPGDLVVGISVLPSAILAVAFAWLYVVAVPIAVAFLLPLILILGTIIVLGGWRASRARTTYLFLQLASKSGIVGEDEVLRTVDRLRREAPHAWAAVDSGSQSLTRSLGKRGAVPKVSSRVVLWVSALAVLAGACAFSIVSYFPRLMPALNPDGPLEIVPRLGLGAAVAGLVIGGWLVAIGLKGKRSTALGSLGLAMALVCAGSLTWIRLTDSRGEDPIVMSVTEYQPGTFLECSLSGVRDWSRPVIIDLSKLPAPPSDIEARKEWVSSFPGNDPSFLDLSLIVGCSRPVGDVKVILPSSGWRVNSSMVSHFGSSNADDFKGFSLWDQSHVNVQLNGNVMFGDITYVQAGKNS